MKSKASLPFAEQADAAQTGIRRRVATPAPEPWIDPGGTQWRGLFLGSWSLVGRTDAGQVQHLWLRPSREPRKVLTPAEARSVALATQGLSNKYIAYALDLREGTVACHVVRAMRKLAAPSRLELVRMLGVPGTVEDGHSVLDGPDFWMPVLPEGARTEPHGDATKLSFHLPRPQLPGSLTEAERDVALRIYAGANNAQIAGARGVRTKTVINQADAVFRKLGVTSRVELVICLGHLGRTRGTPQYPLVTS